MIVLNAENYGAFSVTWMIAQAAKHVPRENLNFAFQLAVEYVDSIAMGKEVMPPSDFMDALGQFLLVGSYNPTAFPAEASEDGDPEPVGPQIPTNPLTEEEIERTMRRFNEILGDAEDPFDTGGASDVG